MDHSKSVSHALEFVQGDVRRILEEEVAADVNNQKISRQAFNRELLKQAATYQEQLFAASDQQRAEMIAQIEQAQREREKTAAAAIESEEKKQAELEAALREPPTRPIQVPRHQCPNQHRSQFKQRRTK